MFGYDGMMKRSCEMRGCIVHHFHPGIFRDKIVASFCNGEFLQKLPEITRERATGGSR